ncbi:hypothetical protein CWO84_13320 [Methylomonas sp. Kb3]|nr:hypothetical protein CWO84_13320 [Methylomonas sp. Kb3]
MEYQNNTYNIEEAELVEFVKAKAVREINIVQSQSKKYRIVTKLTWKEGSFLLVSYRKRVREWSTLDTLFRYIRDTYEDITIPIRLTFVSSECADKSETQELNIRIDNSN